MNKHCLVLCISILLLLPLLIQSTAKVDNGPFPGAPTFTVWRDGDTYYAKNAVNELVYSNTNAITVFQSAIDQMFMSGGTIFVLEGTYLLSAAVYLASNIVFEGSGANTVFQHAPTLSNALFYPRINSTNVVLRNFKIDGQRDLHVTGYPHSICLYNNITNVQLENLFLIDSGGCGIDVSSARNVQINNVYVENPKYDGVTIENTGVLYDSENVVVKNSVFVGCDRYGLLNWDGNNITFKSNLVCDGDSGFAGIHVEAGSNTAILDNTVMNEGSSGIRVFGGIHNKVCGNTVINSGSYGVWIKNGMFNTVSDCMIQNNFADGIYFQNTFKSTVNNIVTNDRVLFLDSSSNVLSCINSYGAGSYGFKEAGTSNYNIVVNSIFSSSIIGIVKVGVNTQIHNCYNGTEWII